jgi:hypothetical protein
MEDAKPLQKNNLCREIIDLARGDLSKVRDEIQARVFVAPLEHKYGDKTRNFGALVEEAAADMRHYFRFDFSGDAELASYIESKFHLGCVLSSNMVFLDILDVTRRAGDLADAWKQRLREVESTLRDIDPEYAREISRQEKVVVEFLASRMTPGETMHTGSRSIGVQSIGAEFNIDFSTEYPLIRQEIHKYVFEFMQNSLHTRASYLSWLLRGYQMCIREVVCTTQRKSAWSAVKHLYNMFTFRPYVETNRRFFLATSLVLNDKWFEYTCKESGYCLSTLSPNGSVVFIRDDT